MLHTSWNDEADLYGGFSTYRERFLSLRPQIEHVMRLFEPHSNIDWHALEQQVLADAAAARLVDGAEQMGFGYMEPDGDGGELIMVTGAGTVEVQKEQMKVDKAAEAQAPTGAGDSNNPVRRVRYMLDVMHETVL